MSRDTIYCRLARPEDIPALIELLRELTALEADFAFAQKEHQRGLEQLIDRQPGVCVLVACASVDSAGGLEDAVVGMCTGQPVISTAVGAPSIWVEDVVITNSYRGRGIARLLLAALEEWADQHGAARMQLLADRENLRALEFYHKQGWRTTNFVCLRKMLP